MPFNANDKKTVKESRVIMSHVVLSPDTNPAGNAHGGLIMKMIDDAAGVVAHRHTRSNVVTASVDKLDFHNPAFVGDLLTIKASINHVGRTSMEIGAKVEAETLLTGEKRHIASAYLTFVALNDQRRPAPVPRLILETEEEERRNDEAEHRHKIRLMEKKIIRESMLKK